MKNKKGFTPALIFKNILVRLRGNNLKLVRGFTRTLNLASPKPVRSTMPKLVSGFTLIELLVVIAIIGILSSVVLASLNSARNKGANAAVKQNLNGIRSQAAIVYDNEGNYDNLCSDPNIVNAINAALSAGGDTAGNVGNRCNASGQNWAINIMLKVPEGSINYWCIDSESKGKGEADELAGATVCS